MVVLKRNCLVCCGVWIIDLIHFGFQAYETYIVAPSSINQQHKKKKKTHLLIYIIYKTCIVLFERKSIVILV